MSRERYEQLRRKNLAAALRAVPRMVKRLSWSREEIDAERETGLRALLSVARERSPWHARRLRDVDPRAVTEEQLAELPTMTKDDLMDNWDSIVTDERLTLDKVESYLEALEADDYLLDGYHACASGGSSGRRGVFVFDWDAWTTMYAASVRHSIREVMGDPELASAPKVMAVVAADRPTHITAATNETFSSGMMRTHRLPITLPFDDIVAGLNDLQPTFLFGYASVLCRLAHEARAGRLHVRPRRVSPTAEPLLPEMRRLLEDTWGVPVNNHWAGSEGGMMGVGTSRGPHMILSDDLLILRPVDDRGNPVEKGTTSSMVHLTNLFNHALPLINYELTDELTVVCERCPYGSGYSLAADVQGRSDEVFAYPGGQIVHPFVFRGPLGRDRHVVEYQVRQTPAGAHVLLRTAGDVDIDRITSELEKHLRDAGLDAPEVGVRAADDIAATTAGKIKRFVPLPVEG